MYLTLFAANWCIPFVVRYNIYIDVMLSETFTSRDARKDDAKQTGKVFRHRIISQPKLHKFVVECTTARHMLGRNVKVSRTMWSRYQFLVSVSCEL